MERAGDPSPRSTITSGSTVPPAARSKTSDVIPMPVAQRNRMLPSQWSFVRRSLCCAAADRKRLRQRIASALPSRVAILTVRHAQRHSRSGGRLVGTIIVEELPHQRERASAIQPVAREKSIVRFHGSFCSIAATRVSRPAIRVSRPATRISRSATRVSSPATRPSSRFTPATSE